MALTTSSVELTTTLEEQVLAPLRANAVANDGVVATSIGQLTSQHATLRNLLIEDQTLWGLLCSLTELLREQWLMDCSVLVLSTTATLRLLRNLMPNAPQNQLAAMQYRLHELPIAVLMTEPTTIQKSLDSSSIQMAIRMATQTLCNLVANNELAASQLWDEYLIKDDDTFRSIIHTEDAPTQTAFLVFIVNSCKYSKSTSRWIITNLIWLLGDIYSWADNLHKNELNDDFELLHSITLILMEHQLLPLLLETLYQPQNVARWLTSPLAIILKFVDGHLNNDASYLLKNETIEMINSIYRQIAQWSINTLKSNSASIESKTSSTSSMPVMSFDDHCTCLLLLLQILIHQSLVQQENISRLEQLLSCTVELLAVTERAIPRTTAVSNNTATSPTNLASVNLDGFNCVKRDTVRLLGNLAHQQPTVQDQIRELGGLALVLGQCSIDDRNPFVREYAIMAIRCLLEGNDTNQDLVAQMAPIAASQHPALAEAGFKVALDDNGKPQLQKLER